METLDESWSWTKKRQKLGFEEALDIVPFVLCPSPDARRSTKGATRIAALDYINISFKK